tara:strand:- start:259 stop:1047 length:789 start_codon:yes stop_codon:yes gene_type:complete
MNIYLFKRAFYFLFVFSSLFTLSLQAQSTNAVDSLLQLANQQFDNGNEKQALRNYKEVLETDSLNFKSLWRTSLLYSRIGFRIEDNEEKKDYYQQAMKYAERTINKYPDKGFSHFVYAVANGRISDISDTKERIRRSHIIKKHTDKAIELLPEYAPAWLLLGVWHSEVANITTAQRLAAKFISEGIPVGASNEKAEEYIKKAIELDPEEKIRYQLDLGRHYKRIGEDEKAAQILEKVLEIEPKNEIDKWNLNRAREILEELQ